MIAKQFHSVLYIRITCYSLKRAADIYMPFLLADLCNASANLYQPLNAGVYFENFIYKGIKMKLCSVCRAEKILSNGTTLAPLAHLQLYVELDRFERTANPAFQCILPPTSALKVCCFSKIRNSA